MTKKDFIMLAEIIKKNRPNKYTSGYDNWKNMIEDVRYFLKERYKSFNENAFLNYIGD